MTLPEPRTAEGAHGLATLLRDPASALLAFDFDGTLSEIVSDPKDATVHPAVLPALNRIAPLVSGLAIVTGRPAETVVSMGGFADYPALRRLRVVGQHGLERMESPDGPVQAPSEPAGVTIVREKLPRLLASLDAPEGVHVEDKGHALVVHTRQASDPAETLERLRPALTLLAETNGLEAAGGKFVVELRPQGMDKGVALHALVAESSPRTVLFAGDDLGDLPAFDAIEALRTTGVAGICVVSASEEAPELTERADLVVPGPAGVAAMLQSLADRVSGRTG